jgi:hypothetical protein
MPSKRFLPLLIVALFLLFPLLGAGCSPAMPIDPADETGVASPEAELGTATPASNITMAMTPTEPPAIPEARQLVLEWPDKIRAGDSDLVRLTLEMDEGGTLTATAEYKGHKTSGEPVSIPNLYATHDVIAEAWLDLAGVQLAPQDTISQELRPGKDVTFYWSLRPEDVGTYRGTAWMTLRFEPDEGGSTQRMTLPPQPLEIRVVTLLGMSGRTARILGGVGTVLGAVFSADDIIAWLRKHFKPKDQEEPES